jgi:hypothetical protein
MTVDEILDDADPTDPDSFARSYNETADPEELAEGVHWRGSGIPSNPGLSSPMASEDLNGCRLVRVDVDGRDMPEEIDVLGFRILLEWGPEPESARESADEGSFAWSDCDTCGSSLGGDRYPSHWIDDKGRIRHMESCGDCLGYIANGEVPEVWR